MELVISGRVQGVNYRATIMRWCRDRGLTGYIINRSDGTVYLLAQGASGELESLIQKCYAGPESAQVQSVSVKYSPLATGYPTFSIKH
jgi:acylphosphatase